MAMIYGLAISGVLAIVIGILILIFPKIINYAIAFYLIIIGILQVLGM